MASLTDLSLDSLDGTRAGDLVALANRYRAAGGQVVVVQGLGFVGLAVAAAVAAARDEHGRPRHLVIGVDLPTPAGRERVAAVTRGTCPVMSPDPELGRLIQAGAAEGNLRAATDEQAYALADVIVVDVALDVTAQIPWQLPVAEVELAPFTKAIRTIGRHMRSEALVLVETTVPVGTTERIVLPLLQEERVARGIAGPVRLAHAYERVMPGPRYIESIRRFWRVCAAVDSESAGLARQFLATFVDTGAYPLRELESPTASELAKLLENSYRAANIALIHEWSCLAEDVGVNLFEVIDAIRQRVGTHDNIREPGFGVGGYCLTKDGLLAQWAAANLFGSPVRLELTLRALEINRFMPDHTFSLLCEMFGGELRGRRVAVLGVAYLPEVGDSRNSPTELLHHRLTEAGADIVLHDPCLSVWPERPLARLEPVLLDALEGADAVVFAVRHPSYRQLIERHDLEHLPRPAALVDAQNVVTDVAAERLRALGWQLAGVGKGHWRRKGYQCRN